MTNDKKFDLEERTAKFGHEIILFCKKVPKNTVSTPIIRQLVESGTAIGAIYCEADDAESGNDFKHKVSICKKEARETKFWLRMIAVAEPEVADPARKLWLEAKELNLIFNSIVQKIKNKKK